MQWCPGLFNPPCLRIILAAIVMIAGGCSEEETAPAEPDPGTGTVTDMDGNVYRTVRIGEQWWMAENLRVTRYGNGDPIPENVAQAQWAGLTTGACARSSEDTGHVRRYGRLYNWFAAADGRGIAPRGWHVPSDAEWKTLERSLGMSESDVNGTGYRGTTEGGMLKAGGSDTWSAPNLGATNETGFSAIPSGLRSASPNPIGPYAYMGTWSLFWSTTPDTTDEFLAWSRGLTHDRADIYRLAARKQTGYAIRCVMD